jgi:hypothetical protein
VDLTGSKVVVWFQVPTVDDKTRAAHPESHWETLEASLIGRFDGLTRGPDVVGAWLDKAAGKITWETSRTYEVDVAEERVPEVETMLRRACSYFGQQLLRIKIDQRAFYLTPAP